MSVVAVQLSRISTCLDYSNLLRNFIRIKQLCPNITHEQQWNGLQRINQEKIMSHFISITYNALWSGACRALLNLIVESRRIVVCASLIIKKWHLSKDMANERDVGAWKLLQVYSTIYSNGFELSIITYSIKLCLPLSNRVGFERYCLVYRAQGRYSTKRWKKNGRIQTIERAWNLFQRRY